MATRKPRKATRIAKPTRRRRAASHRDAVKTHRRRQTPETLRLRSIEPGFTVGDIEQSVRFYTDVLGFVVGERWTDKSGKLTGARLKAGACGLGLSQDDWAKGRDRRKGEAMRIWCKTVQNVDALAARVVATGGTLTEAPKAQPWGGRSFSLKDPDGFHLTIYCEA